MSVVIELDPDHGQHDTQGVGVGVDGLPAAHPNGSVPLAAVSLIRSLVRERIETGDGRQYGDIADLLLEEGIPDRCVSYVLREGLKAIAKDIRSTRRSHMSKATSHSPAASRADRVARVMDESRDVFSVEFICATGGVRALRDFTREDAKAAFEFYAKSARTYKQRALQFKQLHDLIPAGGTAVAVARERVEAIFNA